MFLSWIILIIGTEIVIRTDAFRRIFSLENPNKVRFNCFFASWALSMSCLWLNLSQFTMWLIVFLALILLPQMKYVLKLSRNSQVQIKSLAFLDLILLQMKAGVSFRKAVQAAVEGEKSWFVNFLMCLSRAAESGGQVETESKWFNFWSRELLQIDKSRNRLIEQLEVVRNYTKQEIHFRRKIKTATAGPRAQFCVMVGLFIVLNILAIKQLSRIHLELLLPISWALFCIGTALNFFILRSFKWKV
jgi:hypothetical protein